MPASFNYEFNEFDTHCYADTSYTMVASLDFSNFGFGAVSNQQTFVVNQAIKGDGTTRAAEINKKVVNCCCCNQGDVKIKAYFERSDYMSGENACIIAEVNNANCKSDIEAVEGVFR
jgi:hypothetical protein